MIKKLLIVKPNYKDGWTIPGGTIDKDESPEQAAIREVEEEIGLKITKLKLICIDYASAKGIKTEALQFIFLGEVLTYEQILKIRLDSEELEEFKFVSVEKASSLLTSGLKERLSVSIEAIKNGVISYVESF